jgi:hypothetical protein
MVLVRVVGSMMAYSLLGSTGRVGSTLISLRTGRLAIDVSKREKKT